MLNAVREPYAGKVARTVLRGPRFREGARLPSKRSSVRLNIFQQTRATKFEKRFMNVGPTFEANTKTTGVVKPRMCTFDNPAEFAQTTAVPCPAFGPITGLMSRSRSFWEMRLGVVAAVCVDDLGFVKRPAMYAANRWNGVHQRQQLNDVVAIRACRDRAERNAIGVYEDVVPGPWLRTIRGVRIGFSPTPTARTDEESTAAREILFAGLALPSQQ